MRNIISITTPTGDENGAVIISPNKKSDTETYEARVSRSQTLSGGAIVTHQGFSNGDRVIKIKSFVDEATAEKLRYLFKNFTYLQIAIDDGVFYGAMSRLKLTGGQVDFEFLIQE